MPKNPVEHAERDRDIRRMANAGDEGTEQGWDEPWYRVRTSRFEASFLPNAGEDLDAVCNVDVEVRLAADGSRWSPTMLTLAEVERLMKRWQRTGEELGGRYFCALTD